MDAKPVEMARAHLRRRARRKGSFDSADLSVEELLPDDMGYDADVEIIRPDRYEEPESESEEEPISQNTIRTVDDDLAERMRRLGEEELAASHKGKPPGRGQKRSSRVLEEEERCRETPASPDIEIHEMVDGKDQPSPAKRRRKKGKRPSVAQHILRDHAEAWTDSSERAEVEARTWSGSPTTATASDVVGGVDDEVMDLA